jgi:hypothetical protein
MNKLNEMLLPENNQLKEIVINEINSKIRQPAQQIEERAFECKTNLENMNSIDKIMKSKRFEFLKNIGVSRDLKIFHNKAFYTFVYILMQLMVMILTGEAIQRGYQDPSASFGGVLIVLVVFHITKIIVNMAFLLFSKGHSFDAKIFILQVSLSFGLILLYGGLYCFLWEWITPRGATTCAIPYLLIQTLRFARVKISTPFFMQSPLYGLCEATSFTIIVAKVTGSLQFISWDWAFLLYSIEFVVYIILICVFLIFSIVIYVIFVKKIPSTRKYGIIAMVICLVVVFWLIGHTIVFSLMYRGLKKLLESEAATKYRETLYLHLHFYQAAICMEVFASLNLLVVLSDYVFMRNLILSHIEKYIKIELSVDVIINNIKLTAKTVGSNYITQKAFRPETIEKIGQAYQAIVRPKHICSKQTHNTRDDIIEMKDTKTRFNQKCRKNKRPNVRFSKKQGRKLKARVCEEVTVKEVKVVEDIEQQTDKESLEDDVNVAKSQLLFCPDCGEILNPDDEFIEHYIDQAKREINSKVSLAKLEIEDRVARAKLYAADKLQKLSMLKNVTQQARFQS